MVLLFGHEICSLFSSNSSEWWSASGTNPPLDSIIVAANFATILPFSLSSSQWWPFTQLGSFFYCNITTAVFCYLFLLQHTTFYFYRKGETLHRYRSFPVFLCGSLTNVASFLQMHKYPNCYIYSSWSATATVCLPLITL